MHECILHMVTCSSSSFIVNGRNGPSVPGFFFWQHREYHFWESTEENDTTHGGSWGAWGPPVAYGLLPQAFSDTSGNRGSSLAEPTCCIPVLHVTVTYYMLQSITTCYSSVLHVTVPYYMLQSRTTCYSHVLHVTVMYYMLQSCVAIVHI